MSLATIREAIFEVADGNPGRAAILGVGRTVLTYERLVRHVEAIVARLNGLGYGRGDRVALVAPNGPEAATAFVAISSGAACAPLNPACRVEEFDFYLRDLGAAALIVHEDTRSAAAEAARKLGVPILRLRPLTSQPAGIFDLVGDPAVPCRNPGMAQPADTALLLHTSGTTSRPKLVPLTQGNLAASARHIARTLALQPADRCLNIMPLFHIHGLAAALLASLVSGVSVACTDGLYAANFFAWLDDFSPNWYTAVPSMHRAILARAPQHRDAIARHPLRFIRSSSAALPPQVMMRLEETFSAPVLEAYGMTEASHQMCSNPLPPRVRKPGSVGIAAGPEVVILDEAHQIAAPGEEGEVAIRGDNVTPGYWTDPEANQSAYMSGWFRTGDQGYFDADGYLFLTGRLKEVINRGGEKISPREVDEVLLDHPSIAQAVTFAIPHERLGEEIGVAVVARPGCTVTEAEVREFTAGWLPHFKVPRLVRIVDEIPEGPMGKPQRIGLAAKLGIQTIDDAQPAGAAFVAPRSEVEEKIARIWCRLLRVERAGIHDTFAFLGGDSLATVNMLETVREQFGVDLPFWRFLESGTIATLAAEIGNSGHGDPEILPIRRHGTRRPIYAVSGHDGVLTGWAQLAKYLDADQPLYVFRPPGLSEGEDAFDIELLAKRYVDALLAGDGSGAYRLAGVCFGGVVAFEMARQLHLRGQQVGLLAMFDAVNPAVSAASRQSRRTYWRSKFAIHASALQGLDWRRRARYIAERAKLFMRYHADNFRQARRSSRRALARYRPAPYAGPVLFVRIAGHRPQQGLFGWEGLVHGDVKEADIPFSSHGVLAEPVVRDVAQLLERAAASVDDLVNRHPFR